LSTENGRRGRSRRSGGRRYEWKRSVRTRRQRWLPRERSRGKERRKTCETKLILLNYEREE
jgi:hypothetical protein